MADELRDVVIRLGDLGSELRRYLASLEADPGRLAEIEARLDELAAARRRFRCETTRELFEQRAAALVELAALDNGADPLTAATRHVGEAEARCNELAGQLRAARIAAAEPFAQAVVVELAGLGMGEGEFRVDMRNAPAGQTGCDEAAFLIRPNQGLPFGAVADTASGGELSRVALALAAVAGGETLVFDEIDAGIGGQTAHRVAETLQRLAGRAQLITITHLPQIASAADRHFRVEKVPGDPTHTRIELLDDPQRRDEIERMLGGHEFLATVAGAPPQTA